MVGIQVTKAQVNEWVGSAALDVALAFSRVRQVKAWLDTQSVADLVALGFTEDEANTIKSAYTDLARAAAIGVGADVQSDPYDFTTFARRLWGLGVKNTAS
jgi:hypothetical protein